MQQHVEFTYLKSVEVGCVGTTAAADKIQLVFYIHTLHINSNIVGVNTHTQRNRFDIFYLFLWDGGGIGSFVVIETLRNPAD